MKNLLFSFEGRIGRGRFWFGILMCILSALIVGLVLGFLAGIVIGVTSNGNTSPDQLQGAVFMLVSLPIIIFACWTQFAVMAKRCHDRGKSGWWSLLILIPLVGLLWAIVDLGILEGQPGKNTYGPPPLKRA
ncbi:MAG: DUF805 domain-containing protein [Hyphomicrobiaceae bacterium]